MLENKDIVCVALPSWDGDYVKSTGMLLTQLAARNRVLYVDYAYTYKDVLATWQGKQHAPVGRILGWEKRLRKIDLPNNGNLHVLTPPPVWSINRIKNLSVHHRLLKVNGKKVAKSIRKAMHELNMTHPVVINACNPFLGLPLHKQLGESATIYYCYDEIGAAPWVKQHGARLEEEYMKRVDAVITSSEGLHERKSQFTERCYTVKNGVDFPHFNRAADMWARNKNAEIIVGYVGSMDDRLDYELLSYLATNLPEIRFQFVGRIVAKDKVAAVDRLTNVRFFGSRKPDELPGFMKKFDAGIIPFLKNELTAGIYPLKLNEYLAAGIPVISTDFAPLPEFKGVISVASTPETFLRELQRCLKDDTVAERENRIEVARENSWENRARQFGDVVENVLEKSRHAVAATV